MTEVDPSVGVPGYDSWWDVPVAEVSDNPRVRAAHAAYLAHVVSGTQPAMIGNAYRRTRS